MGYELSRSALDRWYDTEKRQHSAARVRRERWRCRRVQQWWWSEKCHAETVELHGKLRVRSSENNPCIKMYWKHRVRGACLGGTVDSAAVRAAWLRWSASLSSRPRLAGSLCQVIVAYALRLNSRAGTEGSMVSSLICDRWLILGSETLSISRCSNHW